MDKVITALFLIMVVSFVSIMMVDNQKKYTQKWEEKNQKKYDPPRGFKNLMKDWGTGILLSLGFVALLVGVVFIISLFT